MNVIQKIVKLFSKKYFDKWFRCHEPFPVSKKNNNFRLGDKCKCCDKYI